MRRAAREIGAISGKRPVAVASPVPRAAAWTPWLFVLPYLVVFLAFRLGPILGGIAASMTRWNILGEPSWVGLANYRSLLRDPFFWTSLRNSLAFVALAGPVLVAGALALAILLNSGVTGRGAARTLIFAPYAVMSTVVGVIWNWMFDKNFGIVNYYLGLLGIGKVPWLTDPATALPAVAIATIWWTIGYNVVLFLAGLQEIPGELYEAASIDGASGWAAFRRITLPLLAPTSYVVVMLTMINAFQVFDQVFVMTAGGPGTATLTLVQYMYFQAFQSFNVGYGAAIAYVAFALLLLLAWLQGRLMRREVD